MITATRVSKYYGNFQALTDVSFEIKKGEIVGFLGTNGAGKTTLMRILTTYLQADSGRVEIAGYRLGQDDLKIRQKIGYLPETPPLYPSMSVKEYLKFAAQLKDISVSRQNIRIDYVLRECSLNNVQDQTIATLSKGFKQRVGIAQSLIHDPEILILDEPTSGLDPLQILQVRTLIKKLSGKHVVIVSSHILSEIEELVERLLILQEGRIVLDGELTQVIQTRQRSLESIFLKLHGQSFQSYEKNLSHII